MFNPILSLHCSNGFVCFNLLVISVLLRSRIISNFTWRWTLFSLYGGLPQQINEICSTERSINVREFTFVSAHSCMQHRVFWTDLGCTQQEHMHRPSYVGTQANASRQSSTESTTSNINFMLDTHTQQVDGVLVHHQTHLNLWNSALEFSYNSNLEILHRFQYIVLRTTYILCIMVNEEYKISWRFKYPYHRWKIKKVKEVTTIASSKKPTLNERTLQRCHILNLDRGTLTLLQLMIGWNSLLTSRLQIWKKRKLDVCPRANAAEIRCVYQRSYHVY